MIICFHETYTTQPQCVRSSREGVYCSLLLLPIIVVIVNKNYVYYHYY